MHYRIVLAHRGQDAFAQEVEQVAHAAAEDLSYPGGLLEFESGPFSDEPIPQVVVYVASEAGRDDSCVNHVIQDALDNDIAILPVVRAGEGSTVSNKLPEALRCVNAALWENGGAEVARSLLRMLGLVEAERRIFISYRQSETRKMATQLHTELVQRGFDVFLDRFSIEPGVDFQRRLEDDLCDKAFVLLLESDGLGESKWVRHEIAYAHAHRIQILALTLPDCTNRMREIDDAFRHELAKRNVTSDGLLSADYLADALDAIELAHARALRRRREQILGSVRQKLCAQGCECQPADDWCILAKQPGNRASGLFWITPRRPATRDFFGISQQHERLIEQGEGALTGVVVHESGRLTDDSQEVMCWLSDLSGKELATVETCSL